MPKQTTKPTSSRVTYFVVQTFGRDKKGITIDEPIEKRSSSEALRSSGKAKDSKAGAIVFSKTGDPSSGDWEDAVILDQWGEIPTGFEDMMAA